MKHASKGKSNDDFRGRLLTGVWEKYVTRNELQFAMRVKMKNI